MGWPKVLGWVFVPYVMIIIFWKKLKGAGKTFGIIWSVMALLMVIGSIGSDDTTEPVTASVDKKAVSTDNTAKEKEKADKKAATAAKKEADEAAKAEAAKKKAEEKAAAEAEYNRPENVYERWVQSQFSAWDGSATALTKSVKEGMNNPKSFEHVETTYSDKGDMKGIDVYMTFRGTNAFGGVVKNKVHASFDYQTKRFTYENVN